MKNAVNLALLLFFSFLFSIAPMAQTSAIDSVRSMMFNRASTPAQVKKARTEFFRLQEEEAMRNFVIRPRPQDSLLKYAKWLDGAIEKRDSFVEELAFLAFRDTIADETEKEEAVRLMAKSGSPKAYKALIQNFDVWVGYAKADENAFCRKAIYWYLDEYAGGDWAMLPEIIELLSTKKRAISDLMPLTLLLDKIVPDTPFLREIINLYIQKSLNEVREENLTNVLRLLDDMYKH